MKHLDPNSPYVRELIAQGAVLGPVAQIPGESPRIVQDERRQPAKDNRGMNKTEARWMAFLEEVSIAWEIQHIFWEAVKIRLADKTWYTPDFCTIDTEGAMTFYEVKGFMRDDAAVKIKVAAEMYPWKFYLVRWDKGHWVTTRVAGAR